MVFNSFFFFFFFTLEFLAANSPHCTCESAALAFVQIVLPVRWSPYEVLAAKSLLRLPVYV